MESLYFLIPLSVVVSLIGVALFFWAVKAGQYDDLDAEGERLLFDDDIVGDDVDGEKVTAENIEQLDEQPEQSADQQSSAAIVKGSAAK